MSEGQRSLSPSPNITAKKFVRDLVTRRDHSEHELRTKLRDRFSEAEDADQAIEEAIEFAKLNHWISNPETQAQRIAEKLHGRNKGIYFINNYLSEKGLPPVATDRDLELEKALMIVKNKYDENRELDEKDKASLKYKVGRLLTSRGFDSETVRKVLYEKF